jgi:hypothetical protein
MFSGRACAALGCVAKQRRASPAAKQCKQPRHRKDKPVSWYDFIACFFAGMFLANVVPHFVHGISGNRFPTPFAHPPGKGLSSPTVNVVWALCNLVVGYVLGRIGKAWGPDNAALISFFAGIVAISIMLSVQFAKKQAT